MSTPILVRNVHIPSDDAASLRHLYDVLCVNGVIAKINSSAGGNADVLPDAVLEEVRSATVVDAGGRGILLPALCHAHIHLDKCFLLDQCDELVSGDFQEALTVTAKAKAAFPADTQDLYARGKRLIAESVECGVTSMRAHVEVDRTVHMHCLETGQRLRAEFAKLCDVQIAVFAQDPLFDSPDAKSPGENYTFLREAAANVEVQAVGSAPYVEATGVQAKRNVEHILDLACEYALHADLHLDYNVDPNSEPLIWFVLEQVRERVRTGKWKSGKHLCIGHATRLTLFSDEEWEVLCGRIREDNLPVSFVGLPPSDLYMMGKHLRKAPRTTLNVPELSKNFGLPVAMSINNIKNAFTPQGPIDPLALCPLGVAIFQRGTREACHSLVEAVTVNAQHAIYGATVSRPLNGGPGDVTRTRRLRLVKGDPADFVLLHENDTAYSAALNPSYARTTIKGGVVVSRRSATKWLL